jgi:hypothetical protein
MPVPLQEKLEARETRQQISGGSSVFVPLQIGKYFLDLSHHLSFILGTPNKNPGRMPRFS